MSDFQSWWNNQPLPIQEKDGYTVEALEWAFDAGKSTVFEALLSDEFISIMLAKIETYSTDIDADYESMKAALTAAINHMKGQNNE